METVVAVQAEFFVAHQADPVGAGAFAAAVAGVGIEDPGLFRQLESDLHHVKDLAGVAGLKIGEGFLVGGEMGLGPHHQADGSVGFAIVEGKGLLAPHVEQQIALACKC